MVNVGSFEAKTHLPALLERVAKGETVRITRRGVPVARLVPAETESQRNPKETARRICELRRGVRLGKLTIHELIREDRRF